jgi:heme/copper-type cytochrome/quinol oxidase subunit 3
MTLARHPGYKTDASGGQAASPPATTRGTMIRPVFTEIVLFLIPFAVYALFLVVARKGLLDSTSWPLAHLAWLVIAALVLLLGSFLWFATFGGAPPGSVYIPAHVDEHGNFVPGRTVPNPE